MADGRMLKRVISTSPRLAALKNDTHRLIYTWLIPFLDVEGRLEADPRIVKGYVCPLLDHITARIIEAALNDMADNDLIMLYAANGNKYLQLQRFEKHQNIRRDREKPSDIPSPPPEPSGMTPGQLPDDAGMTPGALQPSRARAEVKLREDKVICASAGVLRERFEKFWEAYPKKRSKADAEKAWAKIKPDEQLLATMIAKIEQAMTQDEWIKDGGKFIPYPATWLNGRRWEDETKTLLPAASTEVNGNDPFTTCPRCRREILKSDLDGAGCVKCAPAPPGGLKGLLSGIGNGGKPNERNEDVPFSVGDPGGGQ